MKKIILRKTALKTIYMYVAVLLLAATTIQADVPRIYSKELASRIALQSAPLILDVRSVKEFKEAHIIGAINIPHSELAMRLGELPRDKAREIVVYCRTGRRVLLAEKILQEAGYIYIYELEGHMPGWMADSYPISRARN